MQTQVAIGFLQLQKRLQIQLQRLVCLWAQSWRQVSDQVQTWSQTPALQVHVCQLVAVPLILVEDPHLLAVPAAVLPQAMAQEEVAVARLPHKARSANHCTWRIVGAALSELATRQVM